MNTIESIRKQLKFSKKELFDDFCNSRTYTKYSTDITTAPLEFIQHVADVTGISASEIYYENKINLHLNSASKSDFFRIRTISFMNKISNLERIGDKDLEDELTQLLIDYQEFEVSRFKNPKYLNIYVLYNNFFSLSVFPKFPRIDFFDQFPNISPIDDHRIMEIEDYYWRRFSKPGYFPFISDLQVFANLLINFSLSLESLEKMERYFSPRLHDDDLITLAASSQLKMSCYFTILSNYTRLCIANQFYDKATELIEVYHKLPSSVKETDISIAFQIFQLVVNFYINDSPADYLKIGQYYDILATFGNKQYAKSVGSLVGSILDPNQSPPISASTKFVRNLETEYTTD